MTHEASDGWRIGNDKTKILVVEDDPRLRNMICDVLDACGYEVTMADDGLQAMERLKRSCPDIVITDIFMPNVDGIELAVQIRREMPATSIIGMSGGGIIAKDDVLDIARRLGAPRTLSKPFTVEELVEAVEVTIAETSCRRR